MSKVTPIRAQPRELSPVAEAAIRHIEEIDARSPIQSVMLGVEVIGKDPWVDVIPATKIIRAGWISECEDLICDQLNEKAS